MIDGPKLLAEALDAGVDVLEVVAEPNASVDLLLALLNDRTDVPRERLVSHGLVARESTRPVGVLGSTALRRSP